MTTLETRLREIVGREGKDLDLLDADFASELDKKDPLKSFRDEFLIPRINPEDPTSAETIYFCGNSLGLQPKQTSQFLAEELKAWEHLGVEGHFKEKRPWITIEDCVIPSLASLVGAHDFEVAPMNSLSIDLHVMMMYFYRPKNERYKILMEADAFPSDQHAVEAQVRLHKLNPDDAIIAMKPRPGEFTLRTDDIIDLIEKEGNKIALIMFGGLQFYSGQLFEIEKITAAGHRVGSIVGWDLAHGTGNVPLKLHEWGVDFACWCSYKYLNAGPGCIAGLFVHDRHCIPPDDVGGWAPRLAGWFGHDISSRFQSGMAFKPMKGALGFRSSNPSVLCVTSLRASLDIFDRAGFANLRHKSVLLTGYLELLIDKYLGDNEQVAVISPRDPDQRGCQLSLLIKQGDVKKIHNKMTTMGIICDIRNPNVIRLAPVPLYNKFDEVRRFIIILRDLLKSTE
eukprot:TRINITY_DN3092_c0_g1_i1.p1 TRINITY_DN3092_c0_g1~~TRINITY_DN3092_c0_g1_i1.p1  ORF type:complete len:454 (-),score=125.29 TRINITY_DN3092_c0_g1_i1:17-1378(-)